MCCRCVTHMLLWITSEQSTTIFTSIYKTSKGDIHIPSQDHFIHLLGVYDVHIVLVEVWVDLVSVVSFERYWLRSWLPCILSVNLNIRPFLHVDFLLVCLLILTFPFFVFGLRKHWNFDANSTHPQRPSIIITVDPIIVMFNADFHTFLMTTWSFP